MNCTTMYKQVYNLKIALSFMSPTEEEKRFTDSSHNHFFNIILNT